MNQTVFLDYSFIFDPSEAWSNLHEFESALVKFFETQNLEAEVLKTVDGQFGKRILVLRKISKIKLPVDNTKSTKVVLTPESERPMNKKGK